MIRAWLWGIFGCGFPTVSIAADAAFGDDGKTVFAVQGTMLECVNVTTGEIATVDPEGVREIDAICRAGDGAFYLISGNALWRWKPGPDPAVLVQKVLKKSQKFTDVACNPNTGEVLIVGDEKDEHDDESCRLFYKQDAASPAIRVKLRHLGDAWICSPEFQPDGTLLFSAEGDLWHGVMGVQPTETPGKPCGDVTAYRYAPIAERYTYSGTPSEIGVSGIARGAGHVYVHLKRIGGSGWGHLASLAAPEPVKDDKFPENNSVEDSIRVLKSVKELMENGSCDFLCASPDRSLVYMTDGCGEGRTHYIADSKDGEPIAFRIGAKILIPK